MWTAARTKDSGTKKSATTSHTSFPFSIKEAWILTWAMVLWNTSPPSSRSAGFLNKVVIPCPNSLSLDLLVCRAVSSMSLDLVTVWKRDTPRAALVFVGDGRRGLRRSGAFSTSWFPKGTLRIQGLLWGVVLKPFLLVKPTFSPQFHFLSTFMRLCSVFHACSSFLFFYFL